ncbi:4-alpha-glucanotransferase [Stakelama tenebrarum]|uniref:4-alpha-glucanotransferase n=1 Tax=Stakelama tenebrarum TaxID=2711215 RepID=A0A6G6Y1R9_9SPHN|nr:4-alpha-glucanotransferase [Sphingosinithalassobacter tenebrarum]QIG78884.1 4-alpha-glucanotransferase [Sphingosinithalassobacter tenebrarum]
MSALYQLAHAVGLSIEWTDAADRPQRVSDDALRVLLDRLGFPADSEVAIGHSRARAEAEAHEAATFLTGDAGRPVALPAGLGAVDMAELQLEDGTTAPVRILHDGERRFLSAVDVPGYHRLHIGGRAIDLAIAPPRCFTVADATGGGRAWGASVQIPSLRDAGPSAFGDFGSLAHAARAFAARGADALAISPVHALFPADARRFSPYAPSSRLFLNVLLADPRAVGADADGADSDALIDWEHGIPARMRELRRAFDTADQGVRDAVAAYAELGGEALEQHARFDALHAHFFARSGAAGWQDWPSGYHDPNGAAVQRFAAQHDEEVRFYRFLQWLAQRSFDAAQAAARESGMGIGLIADLAVGMDGGGSHAWSRRDELLTGISIGAPPDPLGPEGQNWGITGFSPHALRRTGFAGFRETLRAAIASAGGIRIDHALGLRRLWVIPEGAPSSEGAYLAMPMDDLMRLIALESHRARAVVIGEDLGTVPPGLRPAMDEKAMLGMRVLWFERDAKGELAPPDRWSADAAAMTSTHDLPTVAGWWRGRDLDWARRLGRIPDDAAEAAARKGRGADRTRFWSAFRASGAARGPEPAPEDSGPVATAAIAHVGGSPCTLALIPIEDIGGLEEQPNLPGTIDEHPNWRRRMPGPTDEMLDRPEVRARLTKLNVERKT